MMVSMYVLYLSWGKKKKKEAYICMELWITAGNRPDFWNYVQDWSETFPLIRRLIFMSDSQGQAGVRVFPSRIARLGFPPLPNWQFP